MPPPIVAFHFNNLIGFPLSLGDVVGARSHCHTLHLLLTTASGSLVLPVSGTPVPTCLLPHSSTSPRTCTPARLLSDTTQYRLCSRNMRRHVCNGSPGSDIGAFYLQGALAVTTCHTSPQQGNPDRPPHGPFVYTRCYMVTKMAVSCLT